MRTTGQKILITGGGSGIGLALARRLAPDNMVVIAGRDEAKLARARDGTPGMRSLRLDVTSEEEARRAVAWLAEEIGGLSILVNNAGTMNGSRFESEDAAAAEADVQINLLGTVRMTRLALPLLRREDQAAVVFVSSAAALVAAPGLAVYAATKAAVHSLARSLRRELRADPIGVFEVLSPWIDTDLARQLRVPKLRPEAVADAVVDGLARDRYEIRVGRIRGLARIARLSPRAADALFARASGQPEPEVERPPG